MEYTAHLTDADTRPFCYFNTIAVREIKGGHIPLDVARCDVANGQKGDPEFISKWLDEALGAEPFGDVFFVGECPFKDDDGILNSYSGFSNERDSCSAIILSEKARKVLVKPGNNQLVRDITVPAGHALFVPFEMTRIWGVSDCIWLIGRFHLKNANKDERDAGRHDLIDSLQVM